MSTITQNSLVSTETTLREYVSTGVMALGAVLFLASWVVLFQWVGERTPVLGVDLFTLFGVLLLAMAVGIAGVGTASRLGRVSATPSRTAGLVVGVLFGGIGFAIGGLVASQTWGLSTVGWLAAAF